MIATASSVRKHRERRHLPPLSPLVRPAGRDECRDRRDTPGALIRPRRMLKYAAARTSPTRSVMTRFETFVFHRRTEAGRLADALLGRGPDAPRAALFLAGPRRTGKTTFLDADLVPLLAERGIVPVQVRPGHGSGSLRLRPVLPDGGDRAAPGDLDGAPPLGPDRLATALAGLAGSPPRPVAVIVDEAQDILSEPGGAKALAALGAVRPAPDAAGDNGPPPVMTVVTAARRDTLARLLRDRKSPFFGARITDLPPLGADYVAARLDRINARLAADNQIDTPAACAAFEALGHRPGLLEACLRDIALGPGGAARLGAMLADGGRAIRERLWTAYEAEFGGLSAAQAAVLEQMVRQGAGFQPFVAGTLRAISARLGRDTAKSTVQSAITELREKGLVWQSGRGLYALEDQGTIPWLRARGVVP